MRLRGRLPPLPLLLLHLLVVNLLVVAYVCHATHLFPGGPRPLSQARLASEEIRTLVRQALAAVAPCTQLEEVVEGSETLWGHYTYLLRLRVHPDQDCTKALWPRSPSQLLRIILPSDSALQPQYELIEPN